MRLAYKLTLLFLFLAGTSSAHADVTDGLVGWWKLDETSGNALDSSGQGNTGTPTGTTILTSGCKRGNCRQFNGSSYIDLNSSLLDASQAVSLSAWVYLTANGVWPGIVLKAPAYDESTSKYVLGLYSSGRTPEFIIGGNYTVSATAIPLNQWVLITGVNDSSRCGIYVNGTLDTSCSAKAAPTSSGDTWKIGTWPGGGGLTGMIDDVRIYNRALSLAEVQAIYLAGTPHISVKGRGKISGMKIK